MAEHNSNHEWIGDGGELSLAEEIWVQEMAALEVSSNQLLSRNTADTAFEWKSLVAGSNVTIEYSAGQITISSGDIEATRISIGDDVIGGAAGSVLFVNNSNKLDQDNGNLFWDDTNNVLGIGTAAPQEKLAVNGHIVFPKASTNGIKVDLATPTFGFADIIGDQFSKNTGGTRPTLTTYNGAVQAWLFGVADEAYISYHIPHDYVAGTEIFLHIHWSHIATTVTGGTVTFKATSIYAKAHNQAPFQSVPAVGTFIGTSSTVQYQQILSEASYSASTPTGIQVDQDGLEPDGVIEMTFEVDANNLTVSGGPVPDVFVHFVDIHYQTTGIIGTKDKAPDFYA